jgi:D-alanyl-D-alanine carboxypeptidase
MKTKTLFALTFAAVLAGPAAFAKTSINSLCYMRQDDSQKDIEGKNTQKEFELASTSKVITSFWSISALGAKYRFQTRLHVKDLGNDTYDVHVQGDKDPYFGQDMVYFLASELAKNGIKKIERLSFDENLEINWKVRDRKAQSADSFDPSNEMVRRILESSFVNDRLNAKAYAALAGQAKSLFGIDMAKNANLQVRRVEYEAAADFTASAGEKVYVLKSAPLYRLLKEMNLHSNNYVADMLFRKLGGPDRFREFINTKLQMDRDDVDFVNGSGDSVVTANGKLYNKASCDTMIRVLYAMQGELNRQGLDLKDVMSVAGADNSTLGGRYANFSNSLVAKTGSVDPAITLAGMVVTEKGEFLFAVLMRTDGKRDWTPARNQIREQVGKLVTQNGGPERFAYKSKSFLPFDQGSLLTIETTDLTNG